jgi:hypothetical protein
VFTWMLPLSAPAGTTAVSFVAVTEVGVVMTPPKRTAVASVKLLPVIVTLVPIVPFAGVNEVTTGRGAP